MWFKCVNRVWVGSVFLPFAWVESWACINDGSHGRYPEAPSLEYEFPSFESLKPDTRIDDLVGGKERAITELDKIRPDVIAEKEESDRMHWKFQVEMFGYAATASQPKFDDLNSLAVAHIFLGNQGEAVSLLKKQESLYPGHYYTATNLGTAYELSGNVKEAHRWIAKGIFRNPESHGGTEWLHLRILEAKMKMEKDPDWLSAHAIVEKDLDLSDEESRARVKQAIHVQLKERLKFVRPPNAVVADLMYSLAEIHKTEGRLREAASVIAQGKRFDDEK